ncbi:hypothetical protein MKW92_041240 [Papaver armeniacum]|nr:hypothetical protein MKW92_041240 [Papaver armeniacum]
MTKGKDVLVHENAAKGNKKIVLKHTARMKVKSVKRHTFSYPDKVINISTDSIESSSRRNQASPTYTPVSPYKKSLNELFDEIVPADVTPDFFAFPVKTNGVRITEEDSAIFDTDVAKGLANRCLLPKDHPAYVQINDQAEIFGICNMNMFRLLSSMDRANQILKYVTAKRDNVIRSALDNRPRNQAPVIEIAFKDMEIQDLKDDLEEYH